MSVSFYWRRMSATVVASASPKELASMVPSRFDDRFDDLRRGNLAMGTHDNAYLMHFVLTSAAADPDGPSRLPVYGGTVRAEGEQDPEYGFLGVEVIVQDPGEVREAAQFLSEAPVGEWAERLDAVLACEVVGLGYSTPWDARWAASLVADLWELRNFMVAAAEAGDAVVKVEVA